ncbi:MAG: hypothetical protein U0183_34765 [Polyangiaceae bacterium]
MALRLCAACARHIRTTESACPFCGAEGTTPVASPLSRATRAAMVFGGAVMVSSAVACSSESPVPVYGAPDPNPRPSATTDPTAVPLYGAPAPDAGNDAGTDATVAPLYGAPADAGRDGSSEDAGRDGSPAPLYGLPPPN